MGSFIHDKTECDILLGNSNKGKIVKERKKLTGIKNKKLFWSKFFWSNNSKEPNVNVIVIDQKFLTLLLSFLNDAPQIKCIL